MRVRSIVVAAVLSILCAVSILAQAIQTPVAATPGTISNTALFGLLGTWLALGIGYWNLNRTIRLDQDKRINELATALLAAYNVGIQKELAIRLESVMGRKEQEIINKMNEERYKRLADQDNLCNEIHLLTQAIYQSYGLKKQ